MSQHFGTKIVSARATVPRRVASSGSRAGQRNCTRKLGSNPRYAVTKTTRAMRSNDPPGSRNVAISTRKLDSTAATKVPATHVHALDKPKTCAGQFARRTADIET